MAGSIEAIFSLADLDARVESGHVRVRRHPTEPLLIANYTSRAANDPLWDDVTRHCRGLIWHTETRDVVARPFAKFFDLHETGEQIPDTPPLAHEKLDGSLGILYRTYGEWSVATRGSFDSDQATWATAWLRAHHPDLHLPAGLTPLVEILYPQNRIVVDHGREELVLLAVIDHATGADVRLGEVDWWPGPVAEQQVVASAVDAHRLATSDTFADAEGLVLTWHRKGRPSVRAKVKHPRYVEIHRLIWETTERDIWRAVVAGDWRDTVDATVLGRVLGISTETVRALPVLGDVIGAVPADVREQVERVEAGLRSRHEAVLAEIDELWAERPGGDRPAFAEWAKTTGYTGILFRRLDGRHWQLDAWARCRPDPVPIGSVGAGDG